MFMINNFVDPHENSVSYYFCTSHKKRLSLKYFKYLTQSCTTNSCGNLKPPVHFYLTPKAVLFSFFTMLSLKHHTYTIKKIFFTLL